MALMAPEAYTLGLRARRVVSRGEAARRAAAARSKYHELGERRLRLIAHAAQARLIPGTKHRRQHVRRYQLISLEVY